MYRDFDLRLAYLEDRRIPRSTKGRGCRRRCCRWQLPAAAAVPSVLKRAGSEGPGRRTVPARSLGRRPASSGSGLRLTPPGVWLPLGPAPGRKSDRTRRRRSVCSVLFWLSPRRCRVSDVGCHCLSCRVSIMCPLALIRGSCYL